MDVSETESRGGMLVDTLEIAATPEASAGARRWLDGFPALRMLGQVAFDVRLLATELVSNSVRHAGLAASDRVSIRMAIDDARVRVEVRDRGPGFDPDERRQPDTLGGRGLQIVSAIANRWGQESAEGGSLVWFELDVEDGPQLPERRARHRSGNGVH